VEHALRVLLADLDLTMALAGYATPVELGAHSVVREPLG
jgi:isopentenyl diphosphate isomerase/L-lactate dehydrogenase-like FMN-dependent dehydrogenase